MESKLFIRYTIVLDHRLENLPSLALEVSDHALNQRFKRNRFKHDLEIGGLMYLKYYDSTPATFAIRKK